VEVEDAESKQLVSPPVSLYKSINRNLHRKKLGAFSYFPPEKDKRIKVFCPDQWKKFFEFYATQENRDRKSLSGLRISIQLQTLKTFENGRYRCRDGSVVEIDLPKLKTALPTATTLHVRHNSASQEEEQETEQLELDKISGDISTDTEEGQEGDGVKSDGQHDMTSKHLPQSKIGGNCKVYTRNADCLQVAEEFVRQGKRVAVLNMANQKTPGGGWRSGSGAQEENLHRRTNLFSHLSHLNGSLYPLPDFGALLSRDVVVVRGPEDLGYPFLSSPFCVDVITIAADRKPGVIRKKINGEMQTRYTPTYEERMEQKIECIFDVVMRHQIPCVVLSAFGCGAYKNPPIHVAEIFHRVLLRRLDVRSLCCAVVFAVIDDHNSGKNHNPCGNYAPFAAMFPGDDA